MAMRHLATLTALLPSSFTFTPPPRFLPRASLYMHASRPSSPAELRSLKVSALRTELSRRGLPVGGKKAELVARIAEQMQSSPAPRRAAASRATPRRVKAVGTGRALLVVESPAKCATISKIVGDDFQVVACNGHVRTIPSKAGSVLPEKDFEMLFEMVKGAPTVVSAITSHLQNASAIYLATDPDREGEAIAWHLVELLRAKAALPAALPVHRVSFSEITRRAVLEALGAPKAIDMQLVRAQQARQAVDYLVGFSLSPVLWRKLPGCRSAGRVQSVALRLIVEREHEVLRFVPREYWSIALFLSPPAAEEEKLLRAALVSWGGAPLRQFDICSAEAAAEVVASLPEEWVVTDVQTKQRQTGPPPPYNTASMQQDASRRLSMGVSEVMRCAQMLYEGVTIGEERVALITYMRTDGVQISSDGIEAIRAYVADEFGGGAAWLPPAPRAFARKARNAQEAHEAVRPVDVRRTPRSLDGLLERRALALYDLVWRRAVASQMASAVYDQRTLRLAPRGGGGEARAAGSRLAQRGFRAVAAGGEAGGEGGEGGEGGGEGGGEIDAQLLAAAVGDTLRLRRAEETQHWTQPPPRFSEGSLVKELEEQGVGRPSTYAAIVRTLLERDYVTKAAGALRPLQRGELVTALLASELDKYVQCDFTARLEADLDAISAGKLEPLHFLRSWWSEFQPAVGAVMESDTLELRQRISERVAWLLFPSEPPVPPLLPPPLPPPSATPPPPAAAEAHSEPAAKRPCPNCGSGHMTLKFSKFGCFVGCSEYPMCGWSTRPREPAAGRNGSDAALPKAWRLGRHPAAGLEVSLRDGPIGYYVQLGGNLSHEELRLPPPPDVAKFKVAQLREELEARGMDAKGRKAELAARLMEAEDLRELCVRKRMSLPPDTPPDSVDLDLAVKLLDLPTRLGTHPDGGAISLQLGRFGPYLSLSPPPDASETSGGRTEAVVCSIPKARSMWDISLPDAVVMLDRKMERDAKRPWKRKAQKRAK